MLLLQANKKRVGILILAFMLVFTFASLAFADTLSLWYGETKKGDISSRKNSLGGTDVAIEEVISSLGLARTANLQAIVVLLDGKKMEFWNASSVVRVNGAIISLPSPISVEDEHWWADAKSLVQIIDQYYVSIGKKPGMTWGAAGSPVVQKTAEVKPEVKP